MDNKILQFPKNFFWGAATSAYQVEGYSTNTDWWVWDKDNHKTHFRSCDHYHLYKEDFDLVKKFNQNIHRLSIEWARIEPKEGQWNFEEIEHYRQVLQCLKNQGIKIMLTLWHFTLPIWLAEKNGWENKQSIFYFKRFAELIVKELGHLVDFWITINEPMVYVYQAYLTGIWPPQKKDNAAGRRVLKNLIKSHIEAYKIIHQSKPDAAVSIAKNNQFFAPFRKNNPFDRITTRIVAYKWNHYFLKKIKKYLDFIGLNYYFHFQIKFAFSLKKRTFYEAKTAGKKTSDLGWEIYPQGIYYVLKELKKYHLPIIITENGLADSQDVKRPKFIVEHLYYVHKAIREGLDVRGYLHWSLIDNYEWAEGYKPKFGLIAVDFETLRRRPRPSADLYAEICRNNGFSENLIKNLKI